MENSKKLNSNLHSARMQKNDEFYTQLTDVEREVKHYKEHFAGKVVYCNCDDPYESNFFKYFALQFELLGLKKLIATCYAGSPIANRELSLFPDENEENKTTRNEGATSGQITIGTGSPTRLRSRTSCSS